MKDHAWATVARLATAALTGLQLLVAGLIALALGIVALVSSLAGLITQIAGRIAAEIATHARLAAPILISASTWAARLACLAYALAATAWATFVIWQSLGADLRAAIPAVVLAPTFLITWYVPAPSWHAALATGAAATVVALIVPALPGLAHIIALFTIAAYLFTRRLVPHQPAPPPHTGENYRESDQQPLA